MRFSAFLGSAIAAISVGSFGSMGIMPAGAIDDAPLILAKRRRAQRGGKAPFRYRTGITYPHSSDRQRARYARQIAAGQLNIEVAS